MDWLDIIHSSFGLLWQYKTVFVFNVMFIIVNLWAWNVLRNCRKRGMQPKGAKRMRASDIALNTTCSKASIASSMQSVGANWKRKVKNTSFKKLVAEREMRSHRILSTAFSRFPEYEGPNSISMHKQNWVDATNCSLVTPTCKEGSLDSRQSSQGDVDDGDEEDEEEDATCFDDVKENEETLDEVTWGSPSSSSSSSSSSGPSEEILESIGAMRKGRTVTTARHKPELSPREQGTTRYYRTDIRNEDSEKDEEVKKEENDEEKGVEKREERKERADNKKVRIQLVRYAQRSREGQKGKHSLRSRSNIGKTNSLSSATTHSMGKAARARKRSPYEYKKSINTSGPASRGKYKDSKPASTATEKKARRTVNANSTYKRTRHPIRGGLATAAAAASGSKKRPPRNTLSPEASSSPEAMETVEPIDHAWHCQESSDHQLSRNRSETSLLSKRDSWIWFSPETRPNVENFASRRQKFCSADPRVAQLAAEIRRQEKRNRDIKREAKCLVESTSASSEEHKLLPYISSPQMRPSQGIKTFKAGQREDRGPVIRIDADVEGRGGRRTAMGRGVGPGGRGTGGVAAPRVKAGSNSKSKRLSFLPLSPLSAASRVRSPSPKFSQCQKKTPKPVSQEGYSVSPQEQRQRKLVALSPNEKRKRNKHTADATRASKQLQVNSSDRDEDTLSNWMETRKEGNDHGFTDNLTSANSEPDKRPTSLPATNVLTKRSLPTSPTSPESRSYTSASCSRSMISPKMQRILSPLMRKQWDKSTHSQSSMFASDELSDKPGLGHAKTHQPLPRTRSQDFSMSKRKLSQKQSASAPCSSNRNISSTSDGQKGDAVERSLATSAPGFDAGMNVTLSTGDSETESAGRERSGPLPLISKEVNNIVASLLFDNEPSSSSRTQSAENAIFKTSRKTRKPGVRNTTQEEQPKVGMNKDNQIPLTCTHKPIYNEYDSHLMPTTLRDPSAIPIPKYYYTNQSEIQSPRRGISFQSPLSPVRKKIGSKDSQCGKNEGRINVVSEEQQEKITSTSKIPVFVKAPNSKDRDNIGKKEKESHMPWTTDDTLKPAMRTRIYTRDYYLGKKATGMQRTKNNTPTLVLKRTECATVMNINRLGNALKIADTSPEKLSEWQKSNVMSVRNSSMKPTSNQYGKKNGENISMKITLPEICSNSVKDKNNGSSKHNDRTNSFDSINSTPSALYSKNEQSIIAIHLPDQAHVLSPQVVQSPCLDINRDAPINTMSYSDTFWASQKKGFILKKSISALTFPKQVLRTYSSVGVAKTCSEQTHSSTQSQEIQPKELAVNIIPPKLHPHPIFGGSTNNSSSNPPYKWTHLLHANLQNEHTGLNTQAVANSVSSSKIEEDNGNFDGCANVKDKCIDEFERLEHYSHQINSMSCFPFSSTFHDLVAQAIRSSLSGRKHLEEEDSENHYVGNLQDGLDTDMGIQPQQNLFQILRENKNRDAKVCGLQIQDGIHPSACVEQCHILVEETLGSEPNEFLQPQHLSLPPTSSDEEEEEETDEEEEEVEEKSTGNGSDFKMNTQQFCGRNLKATFHKNVLREEDTVAVQRSSTNTCSQGAPRIVVCEDLLLHPNSNPDSGYDESISDKTTNYDMCPGTGPEHAHVTPLEEGGRDVQDVGSFDVTLSSHSDEESHQSEDYARWSRTSTETDSEQDTVPSLSDEIFECPVVLEQTASPIAELALPLIDSRSSRTRQRPITRNHDGDVITSYAVPCKKRPQAPRRSTTGLIQSAQDVVALNEVDVASRHGLVLVDSGAITSHQLSGEKLHNMSPVGSAHNNSVTQTTLKQPQRVNHDLLIAKLSESPTPISTRFLDDDEMTVPTNHVARSPSELATPWSDMSLNYIYDDEINSSGSVGGREIQSHDSLSMLESTRRQTAGYTQSETSLSRSDFNEIPYIESITSTQDTMTDWKGLHGDDSAWTTRKEDLGLLLPGGELQAHRERFSASWSTRDFVLSPENSSDPHTISLPCTSSDEERTTTDEELETDEPAERISWWESPKLRANSSEETAACVRLDEENAVTPAVEHGNVYKGHRDKLGSVHPTAVDRRQDSKTSQSDHIVEACDKATTPCDGNNTLRQSEHSLLKAGGSHIKQDKNKYVSENRVRLTSAPEGDKLSLAKTKVIIAKRSVPFSELLKKF